MNALLSLLAAPRLVVGVPLLLALAGLLAWTAMPRQEDPRLPARWAFLSTPYPGAGAEDVERLVLEPIEETLAEIEEVLRVESTARAGVAVSEIELAPHIYDTDAAWDSVRRALEGTRSRFPVGVGPFTLDDDVVTPDSIVVALTSTRGGATAALGELLEAARSLKRELLDIPDVKRIRIVGDPGEEVAIQLDDASLRRLALSSRALAQQLEHANSSPPAGALRLAGQQVTLKLPATFRSLREIRQEPLRLESGSAIPLESVARVELAPRSPPAELMRDNGMPAVGLAIAPKRDVDLPRLGRRVQERLEQARPRYPGVRLRTAMFQPTWVEARVHGLAISLLVGIVLVSLVVFATMGARTGLAVSTSVPLVAFSALALYAAGGGILHQISIAALVLSLGLVVDNAIIMVESVRRHLDDGLEPAAAAVLSVRELAAPLGCSTATTIAAFLPMYLSHGTTADFVRAIPVVVTACLSISYLYALLVTPVLARKLLAGTSERGMSLGVGLARRLARLAVGRPVAVLVGIGVILAACALGATRVERQFFPASDRNQLVVTLELPEGTHIRSSEQAARQLEEALLRDPDVRAVTSFVGRSAPLFYYNLNRRPSSPHLAQLVVETAGLPAIGPVAARIRRFAHDELPAAALGVRRLAQGMPIDAPIEVRVYGADRPALQAAAEAVLGALRQTPGAVDIHHNLGLGTPTVEFDVNDAVAARQGVSRSDIALALLSRSRGLSVGEYRGGSNPVPIVIRSSEGEAFPVTRLTAIEVAAANGASVPLAQVATLGVAWGPGALHHRDRRHLVTVSADLEEGVSADRVLHQLRPRLGQLALQEGVELELGGEAEGARDANAELFRHLPLGVLLLVACLLAEFNSFRLVAIILVTLPLAMAGIVPGLLLSGSPFGFMSLLGAVSLMGIVVNNAIILVDVVQRRRAAGAPLADALTEAIELRTRPMALTTLTTIVGLLPLAFSSSGLWPPMAWAIISGLTASTVLTLAAVPALLSVVYGRPLPVARR